MLEQLAHPYNTRKKTAGHSQTPRVETTFAQRSHYFLAPRIYNQVPRWKLEPQLHKFKAVVRSWLCGLGIEACERMLTFT